MLTYAVILATGIAAYANAPVWVVPAAAAGLTLADWRPWRLNRQAPLASSKAVTYLAAGGVAHLVLAAVAFGAGTLARQLLG